MGCLSPHTIVLTNTTLVVYEKKDPPIFKTPSQNGARPLQAFTAFPKDITTILAARRCPAVTPPAGNTNKVITLYTSTGFDRITIAKYAESVKFLRPDISIALADLPFEVARPGSKKQLKRAERTEEWVDEFMNIVNEEVRREAGTAVFAPVLPVEYPIQWAYLKHLSEDLAHDLTGLAIYDVDILPDLAAHHAELNDLPKLSLDTIDTPHDILRQVSMGIDMTLLNFINNMSDAGIALSFTFPPPSDLGDVQPLGVDMWTGEGKTSLEPLVPGCQCHACQTHHKAFLTHLLSAKEMLGWNLLQLHNHHVVDQFFAGIRETLAKGIAEFENAVRDFGRWYEKDLPEGTGQRPRARGYHFKSEVAADKRNKPAWHDLNGEAKEAIKDTPTQPDDEGEALEEKGFAKQET